MAGGHGGEKHSGGHSVGHETKSHQNIVGGIKPIKMLFDVLDKTIDGTFAEPMAKLGLESVEGVGKIPQAATNLGNEGLSGGGGHHE